MPIKKPRKRKASIKQKNYNFSRLSNNINQLKIYNEKINAKLIINKTYEDLYD